MKLMMLKIRRNNPLCNMVISGHFQKHPDDVIAD